MMVAMTIQTTMIAMTVMAVAAIIALELAALRRDWTEGLPSTTGAWGQRHPTHPGPPNDVGRIKKEDYNQIRAAAPTWTTLAVHKRELAN